MKKYKKNNLGTNIANMTGTNGVNIIGTNSVRKTVKGTNNVNMHNKVQNEKV